MKKITAFTMAEVLMVIGIIGVVAALTLPNLSRNTNDIEYVAKLKKTASNLQNAIDIAKDKYGDYQSWTASINQAKDRAEVIGNRLSDYIVTMKECKFQTGSKCFTGSNVLSISGSSVTSYDSNGNSYKLILNDGTSIAFVDNNLIQIDLDGPNSGYNTAGRDIFNIPVSSEGNLSFTARNNLTSDNVSACRTGNSTICASWIMEFDNNDYVRCSTLAYNGNVTCK